MSNLYNNEVLPFCVKPGADRNAEMRHNNNMSQPLTVNQAAAFLQISRKQLYRLFDTRLLNSFHIGRKRYISAHAIESFIREREEEEQ